MQSPSILVCQAALLSVLVSAVGVVAVAGPDGTAPVDDLTIRYDRPAQGWEREALPIGNGRMGAMLFGGLALDRLQFNEISLWTGNEDVMGAYQAFGSLRIALAGHDTDTTGYVRELDLGRGQGRVQYTHRGVTYHRQYLASHPSQVIVVHLTADKPGACTGQVELTDMHGGQVTAEGLRMTCAGVLTLPRPARGGPRGQSQASASDANTPPVKTMDYESQVTVQHQGGSVSAESGKISFAGCDSLTILLGCGTSYVLDYEKKFRGEHPHNRLTRQMQAASDKSFSQLQDEHLKDYRSLFARVRLDLGQTPPEPRGLTTDRRIDRYNRQGNDPGLEALLFQYGRYLLMSCSRDTLPANLQGLWNDRNNPPWNSDYHTNINVQMNYWLAEPANLSECHLRLFDMIQALRPAYQKASAAAFPAPPGRPTRGWTVRTESNPFGAMGYVWNMGGNAWYALHFWEHYAFTQDKDFLRSMAYPMMKEACEFWEDHLKVLADGRLAVPHGWSPEHNPAGVDGQARFDGVTYDQMMVWGLFTNTAEAAGILGADAEYRGRLSSLAGKLVGPRIGRWGQLQEWMEDLDDPNDQHRHTSHLFGVYPGRQISTALTPDLAKAAAVSLASRGEVGDSRRSWTWPWRCALWARLDRPEDAYRMIRGLFQYNLLPNLLANHPPMQMDGNFGITAAMCELFVQSQAGQIELLPSLPAAWSSGSVEGLRARGGFGVDIRWKDGRLASAAVRGPGGQRCRVRYGDKGVDLVLPSAGACLLDGSLNRGQ